MAGICYCESQVFSLFTPHSAYNRKYCHRKSNFLWISSFPFSSFGLCWSLARSLTRSPYRNPTHYELYAPCPPAGAWNISRSHPICWPKVAMKSLSEIVKENESDVVYFRNHWSYPGEVFIDKTTKQDVALNGFPCSPIMKAARSMTFEPG